MYGPYTLASLKDKGLKPLDMVWFTGLAEWTLVTNVEVLVPYIQSTETHNVKKKTLLEKVFSFLN